MIPDRLIRLQEVDSYLRVLRKTKLVSIDLKKKTNNNRGHTVRGLLRQRWDGAGI